MNNGFLKVAAFSPELKVADCHFNAGEIIKTARNAASAGVKLLTFPELTISGYTCGDLFLQSALIKSSIAALDYICLKTKALDMLICVGLPVSHKGKLFNCGAVLHRGKVLGVVPKTNLPNYSEFYERRQFTPAPEDADILSTGSLKGVPFGARLLFRCAQMPGFVLGLEICEDMWVPCPPSIQLALAGATVIANLSASSEAVGKSEGRRSIVVNQSSRLACAYVYASSGMDESSGDMVFSGHNIAAENGVIIGESLPFSGGSVIADVDVEHISYERRRVSTYPAADLNTYQYIDFSLDMEENILASKINPTPFIPDAENMAERCETVLSIQSHGLAKRLRHTSAKKSVIGISGGLDSTLALLVTIRAHKLINKPVGDIAAVSMPAFGTSARTKNNAARLCKLLGVSFEEIDISDHVRLHFKEIGHDENEQDTTYENAQARIRTLVLMDMSNKNGGIVIGTGDLSELALGWATYNGDHMSMYSVNSGVPKTLIKHLLMYECENYPEISELKEIIKDIINTPVSPELLPLQNGEIAQITEDILGPYEIHDFVLYHCLRWGSSPSKIFMLAKTAFENQYSSDNILKWMKIFYKRFFAQQFKRSCMPDGPKVGSVSLSPRGELRMPSDAVSSLWLAELENLYI